MGSLDPMGVVTDFVHVGLTRFTKLVIKAVSPISLDLIWVLEITSHQPRQSS